MNSIKAHHRGMAQTRFVTMLGILGGPDTTPELVRERAEQFGVEVRDYVAALVDEAEDAGDVVDGESALRAALRELGLDP